MGYHPYIANDSTKSDLSLNQREPSSIQRDPAANLNLNLQQAELIQNVQRQTTEDIDYKNALASSVAM